jgi:hypothetical protein
MPFYWRWWNQDAQGDVNIADGYYLTVGATSQETISNGDGATDLVPEVQVQGTAQADGSLMLLVANTTNTRLAAPTLALVKGGNVAIGTHTALADDEVVGNIIAYGDDGQDYESPVGSIQFVINGTPGTGDMPGSIEFYTTATGGETLTLALTLNSSLDAVFGARVFLAATQKLVFDGGVLSTYIVESSDDLLDIYVGNDNMMKLTQDTTNSVSLQNSTLLNVGAAGNDWTANALVQSNGASTSNMVHTIENTTDLGASNAYVDVRVGGTTSSGDPQYRLTVPSGISYYMAIDNSGDGDPLHIGVGTNPAALNYITIAGTTSGVGTHNIFQIGGQNVSFSNRSDSELRAFNVSGRTGTVTGTDTVTTLWSFSSIGQLTIAISGGGTATINDVTGMDIIVPTMAASITGTDVSGFRLRNAGTVNGTITNQHGIYIEDMTSGGTNDYGIFIEGADTAAIWVNSADPIHMGLAGTATGKLEWSGASSGTVAMTVAAAAGTWTLTLPAAAGSAGEQLTDAAGNGITSWAAASSRREWKNILDYEVTPQDALDRILGVRVYPFTYRDGYGTGDYKTEYLGVMAVDAPWAMHFDGGILNPVSTFGHTVLAIQATNTRIDELEKELKDLREKV